MSGAFYEQYENLGSARRGQWMASPFNFFQAIGMDAIAFLGTFVCLLYFSSKPRSRRFVRVGETRISRPTKRKCSHGKLRKIALWWLYIQGVSGFTPDSLVGHSHDLSHSSTDERQEDEQICLMALSGNGTRDGANPYGPGGLALVETPGLAVQDFDELAGDATDAEEEDNSNSTPSELHFDEDESVPADGNDGEDGEEINQEESPLHSPTPEPPDPPEQQSDVDMGVDAYDWLHLFQFRRGYEMRHCFIRWSNYRNVVSGIANTWDIHQNDVLGMVELNHQPSGIPWSARAIIVKIWGDDFAYDTRLHVLVDIEMHQPSYFMEGPIRDRKVHKMPYQLQRSGLLQITQTEGICHSRMNRCLVSHNGMSIHQQDEGLRAVTEGDYFVIKIPPLETVLEHFATSSFSTSLLQIRSHTWKEKRVKGQFLVSGIQALGNVEDATRDLNLDARTDQRKALSTSQFSRDPTEGLPDPGNPEFFDLTDKDDPEENRQKMVELSMQVPWDWREILKILAPWQQNLSIPIPTEVQLSPVTLQYLSGCLIGIDGCEEIWIYTDGSYNPHLSTASFAVGVFAVSKTTQVHHHFGGWFGGRVVLDEAHPTYTGAMDHNAAEAEISGLIWAHAWAIQSGFMGIVNFCFDSLVAGFGASGQWGSRPTWQQLTKLRHLAQLYEQLKNGACIRYEHTKAHSNQPSNDLMDALAKYCGSDDVTGQDLTRFGVDWKPLFQAQSNLLEWGWWIIASFSGQQGLPCFQGDAARWTFSIDASDGEGITPIENQDCSNTEETSFHLKIATFNVLSLMKQHEDGEPVGPVRASLLRSQLEHAGYHVIGLQETRGSRQAVFQADDYIRVVSGDHNLKGKFGCELWIARRLRIGNRNTKALFFQPDRITVLHGDPRLLVVKLQVDSSSFVFVVGHAPHEQTAEGEKTIWWKRIRAQVNQHSRHGRVFVFGDFNARVAERDEACIGDKIDEIATDNGSRLIQFCQDAGLWLPSTYSDLHPGSDYTWHNPRGSKSRLDYIALEQSFKGCVRSSWTDHSIQVPNNAMDHVLVGMEVGWQEQTLYNASNRYGDYDWEKMATGEGREQLHEVIERLPAIPWEVDVHSHWQRLEEEIHAGLQKHFPAKRKLSRKDIFSQHTWDALTKRKQYRLGLDWIDDVLDSSDLKAALLAWKNRLHISHSFKLQSLENFSLVLAREFCLCGFKQQSVTVRKSSANDKALYVASIGDEVAAQSNSDIFRSLRKLRVGSCFRKKAITPLPQLQGCHGDSAGTWEERDDIWLHHCAKMEAGVMTTSHHLISRIQEKSLNRASMNPARHIDELPSLTELEQAFRRIRTKKAPGADCLRSDLCSLAPTSLAKAYFPLLSKVLLNYNEPLQMKGGVLVAAFKGGNSTDVDCYRSLLLSSHIGKALRRTVRQRLVQRYANAAPSLHVSVKAGGNVMHASHALRSYLLAAKKRKFSAAIVFLDVKSAYYRVIRQLAAKLTCADEDIARVLQYFDIEPGEMGNLLQEIKEASAMQSVGANTNEELITEEFLHGTWFVTKSRRQLVESLAGTRPGDGLADVVFSYVFQRVMHRVNEELKVIMDWPDNEEVADFNIMQDAPRILNLPPAIDVIWADDLAYGVSAATAHETVSTVKTVVGSLFKHCLAHGMRPNMSRNKTEIMLQIRGPNSRQLKKELYSCPQPILKVWRMLPKVTKKYDSQEPTNTWDTECKLVT